MKRLLQRISDGLYYQAPGRWTPSPEQALGFAQTSVALECCAREGLPPMDLVLKFDGDGFDIRLRCWTGNGALPRPSEQGDSL